MNFGKDSLKARLDLWKSVWEIYFLHLREDYLKKERF
jgi:hypothetical protein